MKKFLNLLIFFFACSVLALAAACSRPGSTPEDIRAENPCLVTFDYNGGMEGTSPTKSVYCKVNSLIVEPGYDSIRYPAPEYSGHYIVGYFRGSRDEAGNLTLGEEWDFDTDRVTEDITLYAVWGELDYIEVLYGENNDQVLSIEAPRDDGTEDWNVLTSLQQPRWDGHTFFGFYYDAEYTQPLAPTDEANPIPVPSSANPYTYTEETATIYARFIEGEWTIASMPSDLRRISSTSNIWLMNDIDMSGANFTPVSSTYVGEFNGNGHTISNISFECTTSALRNFVGMFYTLGANAYIHDVTFANVSMAVEFGEMRPGGLVNNYLGLLVGTWQAGARVEDVNLTGTITYDSSGTERDVVCGAYGNYTGDTPPDTSTFTHNVTEEDTNPNPDSETDSDINPNNS